MTRSNARQRWFCSFGLTVLFAIGCGAHTSSAGSGGGAGTTQDAGGSAGLGSGSDGAAEAGSAPDASSDAGGPCVGLTTVGECDARSDCHSVFTDPHNCGCSAAGCCTEFRRCAEGGKANCAKPVTIACMIAEPFCEAPYILSFTALCYDGCVRKTECAP